MNARHNPTYTLQVTDLFNVNKNYHLSPFLRLLARGIFFRHKYKKSNCAFFLLFFFSFANAQNQYSKPGWVAVSLKWRTTVEKRFSFYLWMTTWDGCIVKVVCLLRETSPMLASQVISRSSCKYKSLNIKQSFTILFPKGIR